MGSNITESSRIVEFIDQPFAGGIKAKRVPYSLHVATSDRKIEYFIYDTVPASAASTHRGNVEIIVRNPNGSSRRCEFQSDGKLDTLKYRALAHLLAGHDLARGQLPESELKRMNFSSQGNGVWTMDGSWSTDYEIISPEDTMKLCPPATPQKPVPAVQKQP